MKQLTKLMLCAAFVALPVLTATTLTSCGTTSKDQVATTIGIAEDAVTFAQSTGRLDAQRADQIRAALQIAKTFDANGDTAGNIVTIGHAALTAAESAKAVTPEQAAAIRIGLRLAELATKKQASTESEFPKLSAIAAASQPPTPQPRVTMILTRREAAQIRRADWLTIARMTDPASV